MQRRCPGGNFLCRTLLPHRRAVHTDTEKGKSVIRSVLPANAIRIDSTFRLRSSCRISKYLAVAFFRQIFLGCRLSFLYFPRVGGSVLPRHNLWKRKRGGTMFLPFFPLFATVISLLRFPPSLRTPSANPRGCGPSRGHPYRQVSGDRR